MRLSTRTNLAIHHLVAAALFARNAYEIEQQNAKKAFGGFFNEIMWYVSSAVVMSVAALEAHFNERMSDLQVDHTFLSLIERQSLVQKHKLYLWYAEKPPLDFGALPAQAVPDLIELRDALVHFRPEWDDELRRHAELERRLKRKFATSPFLSPQETFFPKRCMSHGCAAWAVTTARDVGDAFDAVLGRKPKFGRIGEKLRTA